MALGLSLSLSAVPGVSSLLQKLDSVKASFLAVPDRVNRALDKLELVRVAMARNNAPPSAQSDALTVKQHLQQIKDEWSASASDFSRLQNLGATVSLDTVTTAGHLLTSTSYVLANMNSLESSVDMLASKYLTAEQQRTVSVATATAMTVSPLLAIGGIAIALWLVGRRRG